MAAEAAEWSWKAVERAELRSGRREGQARQCVTALARVLARREARCSELDVWGVDPDPGPEPSESAGVLVERADVVLCSDNPNPNPNPNPGPIPSPDPRPLPRHTRRMHRP